MAHAVDTLSMRGQHISLPLVSSWRQGHLQMDDVFHMLKKWCPHNQYVQLACTIYEAHNEFHATSEVLTSVLNWEAALLPTDFLFDKYTELMNVEWHFCLVQPVHVYCPLPLAEPPDCGDRCETALNSSQFTLRGVKGISHEFCSTVKYFCYSIISSTWWYYW